MYIRDIKLQLHVWIEKPLSEYMFKTFNIVILGDAVNEWVSAYWIPLLICFIFQPSAAYIFMNTPVDILISNFHPNVWIYIK